jgi:hypothetical protein
MEGMEMTEMAVTVMIEMAAAVKMDTVAVVMTTMAAGDRDGGSSNDNDSSR